MFTSSTALSDNNADLLLLPILNKDSGYVVFILNPIPSEDMVIIKYIPDDVEFVLSNEALQDIKGKIEIEENTFKFLQKNSI